MNYLVDIPMDRENMYHPSIFQSQATWDAATGKTKGNHVKRPTNPETSLRIQQYLESRSGSCDSTLVGQEMPSVLSVAFMSSENREILQQGLRRGVYEQSGNVIGRQSEPALIGQMQIVYNDHARNVDEESLTWEQLRSYSLGEVKRLNCILYHTVIPTILANVQHYLRFIQEKQKPPPVSATPLYTGMKNNTLVSSI